VVRRTLAAATVVLVGVAAGPSAASVASGDERLSRAPPPAASDVRLGAHLTAVADADGRPLRVARRLGLRTIGERLLVQAEPARCCSAPEQASFSGSR
jgi:hypothetical protein